MSWLRNMQSKYPCQNDKMGEYSMKPFDRVEDKEIACVALSGLDVRVQRLCLKEL